MSREIFHNFNSQSKNFYSQERIFIRSIFLFMSLYLNVNKFVLNYNLVRFLTEIIDIFFLMRSLNNGSVKTQRNF